MMMVVIVNIMKLPISLVIITLNEENNIARCIRSASFASEVIVVDSGSQDNTCEIARSLGAKVMHKAWMGFGPQKAWASEQTQYDWILSLDADEALSNELQNEIIQLFATAGSSFDDPKLDPKIGFELPRLSYHMGRWIRHGGWYPDYQLRLYNRRHSHWPESHIHERISSPVVQRLKCDLQHFVFKNISHQVVTNDRYSGLLAEKDLNSGKKFSVWRMLTKPVSKFFECYFLKMGFLDGMPGFVIAISAAYSIFLRIVKNWEIEMGRKDKSNSVILKSFILFTVLSLVLFGFSTPALAKKKSTSKAKFPIVQWVQGDAVEIEDVIRVENKAPMHELKEVPLRAKNILRDSVYLKVKDKSELRLILSQDAKTKQQARLILHENAEVKIPAIAWEDGRILELEIIKGSVSYVCVSDCSLRIVTPLSNIVLPAGEYRWHMDTLKPSVRLSVYHSDQEIVFKGLERDESVKLNAGQFSEFVGVLEDENISYDILLRGRRVAKGKLLAVASIAKDELNDWQQDQKKYLMKVAAEKKGSRKPSQICEKPLAELNQCMWQLDLSDKKCYRSRCNANGEWVERNPVEAPSSLSKPCGSVPQVLKCDY